LNLRKGSIELETAITPAKFSKASICLHSFFLETKLSSSRRREETDAESLVRKDYALFQQDTLNAFDAAYPIDASYKEEEKSIKRTHDAMLASENQILQGMLTRDFLKAIPPLLQKIKLPSLLGAYSYIPVEIKYKSSIHLGDRLQLFFYAYLLEPILGYRPKQGKMILSSGEETEVFFDAKLEHRFFDVLLQMKKVIEDNLTPEPVMCSACSRCLLFPHCSSYWDESQHISLLSGMSAHMAKKLIDLEIKSCSDLASMKPEEVQGITGASLDHSLRFVLGAQARNQNQPIVLKKPEFEKNFPIYFYDIETYDERVFCHGLIKWDEKGVSEKYFFCSQLDEEEEKWHALLECLEEDENAVVYCWTLYEKTYIELLWKKYRGSEKGYRNLSRNLKDQCAFVKNHFVLPCRGYSIKAVAPYFNFAWQSKNANGMNCIAWYRMWLEEGDLEIKDKIIEYNLDDVRAMLHIDQNLRKLTPLKER
jgi:predicted RecB family nuclease